MGYCTKFSLDIKGIGNDESIKIIEDLRNTNNCAEDAMNEFGEINGECKWYDHEEEMKEFSKKYPDVVFELHGEGEEPDDLWNKYFLNGKMQLCSVVLIYPEYDPKKLR